MRRSYSTVSMSSHITTSMTVSERTLKWPARAKDEDAAQLWNVSKLTAINGQHLCCHACVPADVHKQCVRCRPRCEEKAENGTVSMTSKVSTK
nr:hypothetical protein CFP56_42191 [Quercus suber]